MFLMKCIPSFYARFPSRLFIMEPMIYWCFRPVTYCEEFLELEMEKVKPILQRNNLAVQTEDAIFDTVMRWVQHDTDTRGQHLAVL